MIIFTCFNQSAGNKTSTKPFSNSMIRTLYIKDFALIDELEVSFEKGLNILTGQTGAGKSIIVGALNMILGERADTEVIRQGCVKAICEAVISVPENTEIKQLLADNAVEYSEELILRREIRESGSRAFINDTPVTISVLKKTGDYLVDLHGQHDHQFLLNHENHRVVIDQNESVKPFLNRYRQVYREMSGLKQSLVKLKQKEQDLHEKTELYQFQVHELENLQLEANEEEELEAEMNLLDNAEELDQKAAVITKMGEGEEINVIDMLNSMKIHLEDLSRIEPEFQTYLDEVNSARISIQEAIQFAERYRNGIEYNPDRLQELRKRQTDLNRIQKKYGRTIPELINYLNEIRTELNLAENFDHEIEKFESKIEHKEEELKQHALELHQARIDTGTQLAASIEHKLKHLGISHPTFRVRVDWILNEKGWIEIQDSRVECSPAGADMISFYISTNKGEEPKPLSKIASGGEISRVMLALKSILASEQQLPVMIFDEIDTGISGHISEKVGKVMRELASHCQIIAITHQPQIASQAHQHYRVEKKESGDRTVSIITALTDQEHIREVAGLMSGEQITDSALSSARELINKNRFDN
jgi:DNA repair protein RecN (Recombination protein N)